MNLEAAISCLAYHAGEIYGKKAFQKYVYFISVRGVPLPLTFRMGPTGPFSRELDERMEHFEMLGVIQICRQNVPCVIVPGRNAEEIIGEAAEFVKRYGPVIKDVARRLPDEPEKLELLATVHFVAEAIRALSGSDFSDKKETVSEVLKIKKNRFNEPAVSAAYDELMRVGWIG